MPGLHRSDYVVGGDRRQQMNYLTGLVKNVGLVCNTAIDHIGDDPMLFAVQVSRRMPESVTQAAAAVGRKLPERSRWRPLALFLAGDVDGTKDCLRQWDPRKLRPGKAVQLGQIALAANLPELADQLVSAVSTGSPGLAAFESRRRWHFGDMSGAVEVLASGTGQDLRQKLRLESEMRVFEGWAPALEAVPYNPKPLTVLHFLTNSLPYTASGYAQRSHSLLRAQARAGWAVHAVTRQGYPALVGKLTGRETEKIDGVQYHRLFAAKLPRGMDQRLQAQAEALLELCLRLRPELLHTTTHFVNALVVSTVARALGIPWVYEVRGLLAETWASSRPLGARDSERFRRFMQRENEAVQAADAVITLGKTMEAEISGSGGCAVENIQLIPNAVGDLFLDDPQSPTVARKGLGLDPDALTIGTVSSLVAYEGLDDLIRAFALLAPRFPALQCLIVGDGADQARLKNLAVELAVSHRVSFPGRVDRSESALYHQALDIFVLPRKDLAVTRAVTPLKPVEALASSRPIVFSHLPALHETVREGAEGLSAEPGNPESLAGALSVLIKDHDLRERMGKSGRERVLRERTWQAAATQTIATYERLKVTRARK